MLSVLIEKQNFLGLLIHWVKEELSFFFNLFHSLSGTILKIEQKFIPKNRVKF